MKVMTSLPLALVLMLLLTGCLSAPFQPPVGLVSVTTAPLSTEGNWTVGQKCGQSSSQSWLFLCAWGDCSLAAAARNGGLKKIDYVDYSYINIIGIWQKATLFAYGE